MHIKKFDFVEEPAGPRAERLTCIREQLPMYIVHLQGLGGLYLYSTSNTGFRISLHYKVTKYKLLFGKLTDIQ